jgi:hypothetical protein
MLHHSTTSLINPPYPYPNFLLVEDVIGWLLFWCWQWCSHDGALMPMLLVSAIILVTILPFV